MELRGLLPPYQQSSLLLRDFSLPPLDRRVRHSSGFYAALVHSCLPMFRHNRLVPAWLFKMGPITCSETSGETANLRCVRTQKSEDLIPPLIRTLSHMKPVSVLHPLRKFHLLLSSRLRLGIPSSLLLLSFLNKTFYELLLFPIHAIWSARLFLIYLITQIIFKGQYKSWSPALYRRNFLHSPVNPSLISLSTPPYSWTPLNLC